MLTDDPSDQPFWRELLMAEADGRPIGFMQIIDPADEETQYWGDCGPRLKAIDIWIGEAAYLRRGFGRQMMALALQRCFAELGVEAVLIDPLASNLAAHRFHQSMGFRPAEARCFGDDACLVHRLGRADWRRRMRQKTDDGGCDA